MDRHINEEAKKAFEEAKSKFAGFKDIDWVMPNDIKIVDNALPPISEEQAGKNIMGAMERLYGEEPDKEEKPGINSTTFKVKIEKDSFGTDDNK